MLAYEAGTTKCIEVLHSSADSLDTNVIRLGGETGPTFVFDETFDGHTPQQAVYEHRVQPLVGSCLEGYNATVLAYGQTGSGKTHTIMGPDTALQEGETAGVIPRALSSLFARLEATKEQQLHDQANAAATAANGAVQNKNKRKPNSKSHPSGSKGNGAVDNNNDDDGDDDDEGYAYEVRVQFLEIYGEQIRDLLTPKQDSHKLSIRDVGMEEPEVLGATQHRVSSAEDALLCLTRGMLRRVTGETAMNASSSRSHAILSVMVQQTQKASPDGMTAVRRSKFNFVDLAGSERQKRTKAQGQRLKEGIDINKGLLVLGNVISALGDPKKQGKTFVPYRDSKLTRLLKGSLGGNHKTLMVACVSPSSSNLEESLNCLRYANRAKNIQNNAVVNVDPATRLLAELKAKVAALAQEMLRIRSGQEPSDDTFPSSELEKLAAGEAGSIATGSGVGGGGGGAIVGVSAGIASPIRKTTTSALMRGRRPATNEQTPRSSNTRKSKETANKNNNAATAATVDSTNSQNDALALRQELRRTKELLEKTTKELQTTTEDLFMVRAEKETFRLRSQHGGRGSSTSSLESAFAERAKAYEAEIATLKEAVQSTVPSHLERVPTGVLQEATQSLNAEKAQLEGMRTKLASLSPEKKREQASLLHNDEYGNAGDSPELARLKSRVYASISPTDQLEEEEKAEEAEISAITDKYLPEDDENVETNKPATQNNADKKASTAASLATTEGTLTAASETNDNNEAEAAKIEAERRELEANLSQLSRSIQEKEGLIEQLQLSEEKYSVSSTDRTAFLLAIFSDQSMSTTTTTPLMMMHCNYSYPFPNTLSRILTRCIIAFVGALMNFPLVYTRTCASITSQDLMKWKSRSGKSKKNTLKSFGNSAGWNRMTETRPS